MIKLRVFEIKGVFSKRAVIQKSKVKFPNFIFIFGSNRKI
jgi:hypothetical protein